MKQRGRRSVASLSVVTPLPSERRPRPPAELTEEERNIWNETVGSLAADWFGSESLYVLASYCRHVIRSRWLAEKINAGIAEIGDPGMLERLFSMSEREDKIVLSLARSLRLTVQAKYDNRAAGRRATTGLP